VIPVPAAASFIESWSHSLSPSFIIRAKVVRQLSFQSPMTLHAGMLRWSSLESGERERRFAASSPPSIHIYMSFARARAPMVGWRFALSARRHHPSVVGGGGWTRLLANGIPCGRRRAMHGRTFCFNIGSSFAILCLLSAHQQSATDAKNQSLGGCQAKTHLAG
jgi:hypothetical protein